MSGAVRRLLIGSPLSTDRAEHERVGVLGGLSIFASDALSSVAYGPEEVLLVLVLAGAAGLRYMLPVTVLLAALTLIVATSYRQTVVEYPSGGGSYIVGRENLGTFASHVAGASLLVDYNLTAAVSVVSGVAAITSAWPALHPWRVELAVLWVLFIMVVNLRGVRASAATFALPVYGFVLLLLGVSALGLWRALTGTLPRTLVTPDSLQIVEPLGVFLVLRAFSSGCASLTGVEAIANGVQAFRAPSGRNAAHVQLLLALLLSTMLVGIGITAHYMNALPSATETLLSQIGRVLFGRGVLYYLLQILTAIILAVAANTSFSDFPRLSAFMAKDGYLPRHLTQVGDRLVYSHGIIEHAIVASLLIIGFRGDVHRLIPLYAIGVFTAFTISQSGMVVHWVRRGGPGWKAKAIVNGIGGFVTGVVLVVLAITKFVHGAWVIFVIMPIMLLGFRAIRRHYDWIASRLSLEHAPRVHPLRNLNLLLVGGMHRGTLEALEYLEGLGGDCRAVHIEAEGESQPRVQRIWHEWAQQIPLIVLESPYRNLAAPLVEYIAQVKEREGYEMITVILPEFVLNTWWESLLHNQSALWLQFLLRRVRGVSVLNMRYQL